MESHDTRHHKLCKLIGGFTAHHVVDIPAKHGIPVTEERRHAANNDIVNRVAESDQLLHDRTFLLDFEIVVINASLGIGYQPRIHVFRVAADANEIAARQGT